MGKSVPHHDGVFIPLNSPKSLSFLPSAALGEDAGGDEHTEHFWWWYRRGLVPTMLQKELSRTLGRLGCLCGVQGSPWRDHASKAGGISGGIHSLGGIPALPRCGGLWWHNATPQSFLSLSSAKLLGALTPKLVLQSFIVLCYTECSFSVPLPLDLILENKINCHLSWKEIFDHCQPVIWARNGLGKKVNVCF